MKIRHKQSGAVLESTAPLLQNNWSFYLGQSCYSKGEWEEVSPQPTWRDVSRECYVTDDGKCIKQGEQCVAHILDDNREDRFTKISGPLTPHVAFIVEKRE